LNDVVSALGTDGGRNVVQQLEQERLRNQQLEDDARVYRGLEARVKEENGKLLAQLANAEDDKKFLRSQIQDYKQQISDGEADVAALKKEMVDLKDELKTYTGEDSEGDEAGQSRSRLWLWATLGAILIALAVMAFFMSFQGREEEMLEDTYDEPPANEGPPREDEHEIR
jgi:hypothetical protein